MLAHTLFFYFFSSITIFSAIMVIFSKNTVYSVFFLILVFINVSILFITIGAEFLGMIMLIVYVGAVAVLFLFVVMMLNVNEQLERTPSRKGFLKFGHLFFYPYIYPCSRQPQAGGPWASLLSAACGRPSISPAALPRSLSRTAASPISWRNSTPMS